MTTMTALVHSGELSGYFPGTPGINPHSLLDGADIDGEIATATPCPHCGGKMSYEPYTQRQDRRMVSYRAFAVCTVCDYALEF